VRVLVVEDSAPNRKLLCALLARLKCKVTSTSHGKECVDLFAPLMSLRPPSLSNEAVPQHEGRSLLDNLCPFDLVLMDNSMPVMDGMTATRILREAGFHVPIIGVTGNALEEDLKAFLAAGANEILTKPVRIDDIKTVITKYTQSNTNGNAAANAHTQSVAAATAGRRQGGNGSPCGGSGTSAPLPSLVQPLHMDPVVQPPAPGVVSGVTQETPSGGHLLSSQHGTGSRSGRPGAAMTRSRDSSPSRSRAASRATTPQPTVGAAAAAEPVSAGPPTTGAVARRQMLLQNEPSASPPPRAFTPTGAAAANDSTAAAAGSTAASGSVHALATPPQPS
jgi:CheY-like chemotaxis protein